MISYAIFRYVSHPDTPGRYANHFPVVYWL